MSDPLKHGFKPPPEQQTIRDKCFHPSGTFVEFPKEDVETSIPERFEKIVRMYSEQLALKKGSRYLTYDALNRAANRLAHHILSHRGRRQEPVGIYLQDKSAMIIAFLGILKAGKFFVPLDPSFPKARNSFVIEDCGAKVIVTDRANLQTMATLFGSDYHMVILEDAETTEFDENPARSITGEHLACVFHTSGSTGNYKGIADNQINILHDIRCFVNQIHVNRHDRFTLLHSLSFHATILHLFGSLLMGASLFPYDVVGMGVSGLANWLRQEDVTVWHSIPTLYREMIATLSEEDRFPSVRLVSLSGAPTIQNDLDNYRKYFPRDSIFLHRFGATETGTISCWLIDQTNRVNPGPIPVGWAPEGKQLLLLDENGHEVGFGEIGEIALRTRFMPQGYWKHPEPCKERFRSDLDASDQRIYLTGDLGRMTAEHGLILLGRKDLQLKIRGFRIEPEQVEGALLSHPAVKDAVVVGMTDGTGLETLISYFTSAQLPAPKVDTLRRYLEDKLPDYMIPSLFVQLDAIPLTANGKVDRQRLSTPTHLRPDLDVTYIAPSGGLEQQLVSIWEEVLAVFPIGIHDNLFDLGGHSLAAMRIVSRVIKQFQLVLPLQSLFLCPTVAEMAAVIMVYQGNQLPEQELKQMLDELEAMTEQEAERLKAKESIAA